MSFVREQHLPQPLGEMAWSVRPRIYNDVASYRLLAPLHDHLSTPLQHASSLSAIAVTPLPVVIGEWYSLQGIIAHSNKSLTR